MDVSAPGAVIRSTFRNARYGDLSGSSMACPYVSGTLALMMAYVKGLPRQTYVDCLLSTSSNVDDANVPLYPPGSLGAGSD